MRLPLKFVLVFLLINLGPYANGQDSWPDELDCSASWRSATQRENTKGIKPSQKISVGVINGRARKLVRPQYPRSADDFSVSGMVSISVLIDERGCIEEATALRGHPMLVPASLRAAKESSFFPIHLSNLPVKVTGVIVYCFKRDRMNWLEIGFSSGDYRTIAEYLSAGLEYEPESMQNRDLTASVASIQDRLKNEQMPQTLFAVGRTLKKLSISSFDLPVRSEALNELRDLLDNAPSNIAPKLIEYLVELLKADESELLDRTLFLSDRFYELGK